MPPDWDFPMLYHYAGIPLAIIMFMPLFMAVVHEAEAGNKLPFLSFFILLLWYSVRWRHPCMMCTGKKFCKTCPA